MYDNTGFIGMAGLLAFLPNPIISTNEAWFLSNTEKVHALFKKLNECIEQINTYGELFKEIKDILDEFDDTVKQAVSDYIQQMYENGELREILVEVAQQYYATEKPKNSNIDFMRLWRSINKMEDNSYASSSDVKWYAYTQGAGQVVHNNTRYIVMCNKIGNITRERYNNTAKIVVYDEDTGDRVAETDALEIGHANAIAYLNGYIYVVHCYYNENETETHTNNTVISKIDFQRILDGGSVTAEPYHSIKSITLSNGDKGLSSISAYNGKLYINSAFDVFELDWDNATANLIYDLPLMYRPPEISGKFQGMSMTNDYIYFLLYSPSIIMRYNKTIRKIDWIYNIERILNDGMFRCGEPEGLTVYDNGDVYLITAQFMGMQDVSQWCISQVFKQNLSNNLYINSIANKAGYFEWQWERLILEVTSDVSGHNPFRYFNTISEAVWFAQSQTHRDSVIIRLRIASGYSSYFCTNKTIHIETPLTYEEEGDRDKNKYIGNVIINGCPNISFRNVNFRLVLTHDAKHTAVSDAVNRYIVALYCNLSLHNCNFDVKYLEENNRNRLLYAMHTRNSFMTFSYKDGWNGTTNQSFNDLTWNKIPDPEHPGEYLYGKFLDTLFCTINGNGNLKETHSTNIVG